MAEYFLDPNADITAKGTEVPAGSAFARLDDGTRQPTVPDTGTDYITHASGESTVVDLTTTVLAGGETPVCARAWVYIDCSTRAATITLNVAGFGRAQRTIAAGTAAGWQAVEAAGSALSQSQVNSLSLNITGGSGSGSVTAYSAYVHLYTRTDIYTAANAKFHPNKHADTGLSTAAGIYHSDVGPSVDLGAGVSLAFGGDNGYASAAGQQFFGGGNVANPGAAQAGFLNNHALIIDAYNLDTANFTFFHGAGPSNYFADVEVNGESGIKRWPLRPFIVNSRLWVVGMLVRFPTIQVVGMWAAYSDDYDSNPTNPALWTWTQLPYFPPYTGRVGVGEAGHHVEGGFVHLWSIGGKAGQPVSCYRVDEDDFHAGLWTRGTWFNGTDFVEDRPGMVMTLPQITRPRKRARGEVFATDLDPSTERLNGGHVIKRGDGKFQFVAIYQTPGTAGNQCSVSYALTPSTTIAPFGAKTDEYAIPEGEDYVYSAAYHSQLTWTGKGADDQVWSYASGWSDDGGPTGFGYGTRFVKALSIT